MKRPLHARTGEETILFLNLSLTGIERKVIWPSEIGELARV